MNRVYLQWAAFAFVSLLAGCFGGDADNASVNLNGLAAGGAAIGSKSVTIRCANAPALTTTTTTDAGGRFDVTLVGQQLPCMLEVESPTLGRLHGLATAAGRVNVTPLTELIVARAARANPVTVFAGLDAATLTSIAGNLDAAVTSIVAGSSRLLGSTPSGNPLTMMFAIGDDDDKALDSLSSALARASATLGTLTAAAAAGTALVAALPAEESRGHDAVVYTVNANDAAATTFAPMAAAATDVVDMSTTQRFAGRLASYDNNPSSPYAAYRIEVPANWNGDLVMYAHGYVGEGAVLGATDTSIRRYLIQNGYAWAASSYSKNSYDVRAGIEDTNKLALAFGSITGKAEPTRIYIIGHSMGGHVAAAALEEEALATAQNKVRYAGGVPMCGVVGDTELFNGFSAQALAALTLSGYNNGLPGALPARQRLQMMLQASFNPNSVALTVHSALFSGFPNAGFTPSGSAGLQYVSVLKNLTGGTRPMFDIGLSYGGSYISGAIPNFGVDAALSGIGTKYNLDTSSITYTIDGDSTATSALNSGVPRVSADANWNPLRRDGLRWVPLVGGKPYAPVVTLHTLGDLFVPFSMEQVYRTRLTAAGTARAERVVQRSIRGVSHCDFTNAEMETAFGDMVKWVKEGTKPAGDDVITPAAVAATTYGCTFTKNVFHAVDEGATLTRTLRGLITQLGQKCPGS